jgi:hypothetical protein
MRRQEAAASICEEKRVLFLPNLPIRYIQNDIPGSSIKPDEDTRNFLQALTHTQYHYVAFYHLKIPTSSLQVL